MNMLMPSRRKWDHYGLPVYEMNGQEWAYAPDNIEADRAAKKYILDTVWAFRPEFLLGFMPHGMTIDAIKAIQEKYEDANGPLLALIRNKKKFVSDAISADGRGHFLSPYDGEERDAVDIGGLPSRRGYAYRVN